MVTNKPYRIGIVGASSLAGRELADTLVDSSLAAADIVLLDDETLAGQMTATGDEPAFLQKLDADSFAAMDFVFFTGEPATTRKYWKAARLAGASLIDLTNALASEPGVVVRAPLAGESSATEPDLTTPAVVPAHPAAVMLLLVANRIAAKLPLRSIAATVFEPASEHGQPAMDELHQQTVALLSFQSLPREQYDAQVAFNLLPSLGDAAKINLAATESRIFAQYAALSSTTAPELALQLVQAPIFHSYAASILIELQSPTTTEQLEAALAGDTIDIVSAESDAPSNVSAAGQPDILVRVRSVSSINADAPVNIAPPATRFWLWLAADNLKLSALNAIACASELRRLRPQGKVQ